VLLTWQGRLRDSLILAHELGHAVQGYIASRSQTISNARPGTLFVEVPSSLAELMLADHLLETATDPRRRRWVLAQVIDTPFLGTFTNSVLMGHLERRLYGMAEAGQPITPAALADAQTEVFERYFAGALVVDEGARLDWVRFPQYYAGLYLFTYAAGLCCACGLVDAIRREGRPAADRWMRAVKAGGTLPPLELMRLAGADMTSSEPIQRAVELFGRLIDELEGSFPEERASPVR
jgi:oligoendopeptidase F